MISTSGLFQGQWLLIKRLGVSWMAVPNERQGKQSRNDLFQLTLLSNAQSPNNNEDTNNHASEWRTHGFTRRRYPNGHTSTRSPTAMPSITRNNPRAILGRSSIRTISSRSSGDGHRRGVAGSSSSGTVAVSLTVIHLQTLRQSASAPCVRQSTGWLRSRDQAAFAHRWSPSFSLRQSQTQRRGWAASPRVCTTPGRR